MGISSNYGYNIGLELTTCYSKYFDHREVELNGLIDSLKMTNMQIKIIADLMNKLSHGKQENKQADLNPDEQAKKCAYLIHLGNPTIFGDKVHGMPEGEITLEQKLQEIIDQLKREGIPESQINLGAILEKINVSGVNIGVLNEEDIDVIIQGLDSEMKMHTADLNERMMKINNKYEDRSQMTENARLVLKEANDHNISIIHKTKAGG